MEAIVVCGMSASGKTDLAKTLSSHFGLPLLGGTDILKEMAVERGYRHGGDDWWDSSEGLRFLKERESNAEFDKETDRKMKAVIEKGNVVVTSYTAPWITNAGFKIWLSATAGTRAERMAHRDHSDVGVTVGIIAERDEENRKLYKRLYNIDFGRDISPFDLVIETDGRSEAEVAQIAIEKLEGKMKE